MPSRTSAVRALRRCCAGLAALLAAAAAPASAAAQLLVVESRIPGQPAVGEASYALAAEALDKLKGVKVVPVAVMKTAIATATPTLHLVDAPRLKILGDKVTAAYALAGGADPKRAVELAREVAGPLLLATVAGGEAEVRAVFFGCMAALAEANRNMGRTADAVAALRDAALYVSEYEVTPDAYPAPLVDLYNRARADLSVGKGTLEVSASDPSAELTVDGISAGKGSFTGDLPRGEHYAYAKAGKASSAMMRFTVGGTRASLRLELVDPDLPKFGPYPYVTFSGAAERTTKEPEIAVTLARRGGATGAAFLSFDGTNVEVRVYDPGGRPLAAGAARPKAAALQELAEKLHPYVPRFAGKSGGAVATASGGDAGTHGAGAAGGGDGSGKSDHDHGAAKGEGDSGPPPPAGGDGDGSGHDGARHASSSGAAFKPNLSPVFFGASGAFAVGLVLTATFAGLGAKTEREIRDYQCCSGFFDYDFRLRLRREGRTYNALAVVSLLVTLAGGATAVVVLLGGKKKSGSGGDAGAGAGRKDSPRAALRVAPDGSLLVEF
jgi:hypothetical protein